MPGMYSQRVNVALTNLSNNLPAATVDYSGIVNQHTYQMRRALLAQALLFDASNTQTALVKNLSACVTAAIAAEVG